MKRLETRLGTVLRALPGILPWLGTHLVGGLGTLLRLGTGLGAVPRPRTLLVGRLPAPLNAMLRLRTRLETQLEMRLNAPLPNWLGTRPAANSRLTALLGVVLLLMLIVQVASALFFALLSFNVSLPPGPIFDTVRPVHFFVGLLLLPVVALKLVSTGWKFAMYYLKRPAYKRAGAPSLAGRLVGPLMAASITVLFFSGIEMWSFRNQFIAYWTQIHVLAAIAFVTALMAHLVLNGRRAHREAAEDLAPKGGEDLVPGRLTRRGVVAGGIVAGLVLAVSGANWPSPMLSWLYDRKVGPGPLDFPVMDYEGGGQTVDLTLWRLRVTGTVRRPIELDYQHLLALPSEEHEYPINCVTGWSATRRWRGVPVATLLRLARAVPDFGHVLVRSTSGYHWDHHRQDVLLAGAMLVTHVDGVPLNRGHGFPTRLLIPGQQGQSNIKWVDALEVGRGPAEFYVAPNLVPRSQPVTGPFLPRDPAGMG